MRVYNRDTLAYMMRKPFHLADSLKLPLYCGEFGIYEDFFPEAKLAWYRDMISIFEEHGVAYANWNYKSGSFGIVDDKMKPFPLIIDILVNANEEYSIETGFKVKYNDKFIKDIENIIGTESMEMEAQKQS